MAAHISVLGAEGNCEGLPVQIVGIFDHNRDRIQNQH